MALTYRRFFKIMAHQFQNKLIIPEEFMERFEGRLGSSCMLRGPSGDEWWVHLRQARGSTSFSEGWSGFVADHRVNPGDHLVFTYTGNSSFKVWILDPTTQMERESALLAHNSSSPPLASTVDESDDHDDDVVHIIESDDQVDGSDSVSGGLFGGDQAQAGLSAATHDVSWIPTRVQTRAMRGKSTATTGPASQARAGPSSRRRSPHGGEDESYDDDVVHIEESDDQEDESDSVSGSLFGGEQSQTGLSADIHDVSWVPTRAQTRAMRRKSTTTGPASQARAGPSRRSRRGGEDESCEPEPSCRKGRQRTSSPGCGQFRTFYTSKRRRVTKEEIEQARNSATSYISSSNNQFPKFQSILAPINVYYCFYLNIPKTWALRNMRQIAHDVTLKVVGQLGSWTVGCWWSRAKQCRLRAGWPEFVRDNNLEEHDACVFERVHAWGEDGDETTVFNVHIFRALKLAERVERSST